MRIRFLLPAFVLIMFRVAAHADTTYTYTGPYFTTASGPYTTSDRVTGTFTLATPVAPNMNNQSVTPTSYSFSDGVDTFTQSNSYITQFNGIQTDAQGNFVDYLLGINFYSNNNSLALFDSGNRYNAANDNAGDFAQVNNSNPIYITPATSVTPEPSSFALLGTGLLGAAGVIRRRFV